MEPAYLHLAHECESQNNILQLARKWIDLQVEGLVDICIVIWSNNKSRQKVH